MNAKHLLFPLLLLPLFLVSTPSCSSSTDGATESSSEESEADSSEESEDTTSTTSNGDGDGDGDGDSAGDGDGEATGDGDGDGECALNVVIMGYWPPTNEMLRQWSPNEAQNPEGWQGENWGGHGFNVYAFFPEFPPDGDPSNNPIGSPGAVGSKDSDLQVDYQDTSQDFWQIVDDYQPVILITTSRGGGIGWELEALEGGHGDNNDGDPSLDWSSDGYGDHEYPTQETVDPRSWIGLNTYRKGNTLPSQLPLEALESATEALDLVSVEINQGTSGNFLSGFLGLHGLLYNELAEHNIAAGHIHVGIEVPTADAEILIETTLQVVLETYPAQGLDCPPRG